MKSGKKRGKIFDDRLKGPHLLRDLDKTLAIAGIFFALILIAYVGMIDKLVYLPAGIFALISCLLWLAIRKSYAFEFHILESWSFTALWSICYFMLFALSILSVHFRPDLYERPLLYFILTALMAGAIACKIFSSGRQHVGLILIQIMLLGVSIAWSQLLIFPGLLGVDPWYHYDLTIKIIDEGFLPEKFGYSKLPLFHLTIAATSLIAGLPYKLAAMVSVSLGQIVCNALFVFLIASCLFSNYRAGLLAALMVIIANQHICMSYWSIPNGFAAVFIPIAFYLLFFKSEYRSILSSAILSILVLAAIILTHSIAALCMAMLLVVSWGSLVIYSAYNHSRKDIHISLIRPIGFAVSMLAWWAYASGTIVNIGSFFKRNLSIDLHMILEEFRGYALDIPLDEKLFNDIGMHFFFAFSLIGIFYMISRRGSGSSFAMAWVGMTPFAIGFLSLMSGIDMIEQRWWYFVTNPP